MDEQRRDPGGEHDPGGRGRGAAEPVTQQHRPDAGDDRQQHRDVGAGGDQPSDRRSDGAPQRPDHDGRRRRRRSEPARQPPDRDPVQQHREPDDDHPQQRGREPQRHERQHAGNRRPHERAHEERQGHPGQEVGSGPPGLGGDVRSEAGGHRPHIGAEAGRTAGQRVADDHRQGEREDEVEEGALELVALTGAGGSLGRPVTVHPGGHHPDVEHERDREPGARPQQDLAQAHALARGGAPGRQGASGLRLARVGGHRLGHGCRSARDGGTRWAAKRIMP